MPESGHPWPTCDIFQFFQLDGYKLLDPCFLYINNLDLD